MRQHFYEDVSNLNAPYDIVPLRGLGQAADDPKFPWKVFSQDTLTVQQDLNEWLTSNKGCLLQEDGLLGGKTCGAIAAYGGFTVATCSNHASESVAPQIPCGQSSSSSSNSQPATEVQVATVTGGGIPGWMIGVGLGVLAIGTAMYLGKKKKR